MKQLGSVKEEVLSGRGSRSAMLFNPTCRISLFNLHHSLWQSSFVSSHFSIYGVYTLSPVLFLLDKRFIIWSTSGSPDVGVTANRVKHKKLTLFLPSVHPATSCCYKRMPGTRCLMKKIGWFMCSSISPVSGEGSLGDTTIWRAACERKILRQDKNLEMEEGAGLDLYDNLLCGN